MSNCIQTKCNNQSKNNYYDKGQLYLFCLNKRHHASYNHRREDDF